MSLFAFAQGNGHASPGCLPLATIVSLAAHAAALLSVPLLPAAPMAPRPSLSAIHVELAPPSGAARAAAVRVMQHAPAPSRRAKDAPARPPAQPVDAPVPESPELSRAGAPTKPHAPTPTEETSESDYARVGGATAIAREAPAARYAPAPAYPEEARWEQRTGRVVLSFHIRLDGTVGDARVLDSSGHADLDHAAIAALHEWKFDAPPSAMLGAWYRYAFRFDLM